MSERQTAAEVLASYQGRPLRIMEVCGTPVGFIDEAVWLAEHGVTVATFGDLVRVPGTE